MTHIRPVPSCVLKETPILCHMREQARDFGIVDLLLTHQRIVYERPAEAYDLVETVLMLLGTTSRELLDNLERAER